MRAELTVASPAGMQALGRRLAALLRPGDLVLLTGPLGAGKTTLVQGIGAGLRVRGPVTSPTFVIARVHPSLAGGGARVIRPPRALALAGPAGHVTGTGPGRVLLVTRVAAAGPALLRAAGRGQPPRPRGWRPLLSHGAPPGKGIEPCVTAHDSQLQPAGTLEL